MKKRKNVSSSVIRQLIETARENGHEQWSKSLPYIVEASKGIVTIKTEGGMISKDLDEVIMNPEFIEALVGKENYLSKRYKRSTWPIFANELFKKLQEL
ncbi:MAG: hypothetical protein ACI9DM_000225 [Cyclobacteriaceae bacterium]|jgi:hypothetical protein